MLNSFILIADSIVLHINIYFTQNSGEEETYFDPSTRAFSQEELKPQPIIRKSRKTFVPPDDKVSFILYIYN